MALNSTIKPIELIGTKVILIDQTILPNEYKKVEITNYKDMAKAIKEMIVRGAPAIGIAGAHGIALAAMEFINYDKNQFFQSLRQTADYLISQRPTAVNLAWAVEQLYEYALKLKDLPIKEIVANVVSQSKKMELEDIKINKKIGDFGAEIVPKGATILTHCNAGALATVGYGTALGVVRSAFAKDQTIKVFADETRPRLQGAKLTTWELIQDNIPVTLITDGMSGYFMQKGMIDMVIVGADRIAANGDTANKIGTYNLAIVAKFHKIPFYVAAPLSTIDINIASGEEILIEEREQNEVTYINGKAICAKGVNIINPAFDVTYNNLITGIITEKGILRPNYSISIKQAKL